MATCSPQALLDDAAAFAAIPRGMLDVIQTALLCRIAQGLGMSCNAQSLIDDAACFACLSPGELALVQLQLLCNIATALSGGSGSIFGVICGTSDPVAAPSGACGIYYRTDTGAMFIWTGAAWVFKV